jgi:DNA-binding XRE family transcriptional regulator
MQKLAAHLRTEPQTTRGEWARRFGISRPYLYGLVDGERSPSLEVAQRIARATDGAVPVSSWPKLAALLAEAKREDAA